MTDTQINTAIANIADGTPNTAEEIRTLFQELFLRVPKTGWLISKDVSNAYIAANFDGTGLGINLEAGYAMCNGQNGTRNHAERVQVAYGGTMLTAGATGGSKDAVVVAHTHNMVFARYPTANNANPGYDGGSNNYITDHTKATESTGVDGSGKNMQPYIVTLVTQKL